MKWKTKEFKDDDIEDSSWRQEGSEIQKFLNFLTEKQATHAKIVCRSSSMLGAKYFVIYPEYEE